MFKRSVTCALVGALSLAAWTLVPADVSARGFGRFHARGLHQHRLNTGLLGPVATYTPTFYGQPVYYVVPAPLGPLPTPMSHCTHSRETIVVPAEDGGERRVTITRC